MIVKLTNLVGRPVWVNVAEVNTVHVENDGTEYAFTQISLESGAQVRVKERPEQVASGIPHGYKF